MVIHKFPRREDPNQQRLPNLGRLLKKPSIIGDEVPVAILLALHDVEGSGEFVRACPMK